jgi:hypothetical protein
MQSSKKDVSFSFFIQRKKEVCKFGEGENKKSQKKRGGGNTLDNLLSY